MVRSVSYLRGLGRVRELLAGPGSDWKRGSLDIFRGESQGPARLGRASLHLGSWVWVSIGHAFPVVWVGVFSTAVAIAFSPSPRSADKLPPCLLRISPIQSNRPSLYRTIFRSAYRTPFLDAGSPQPLPMYFIFVGRILPSGCLPLILIPLHFRRLSPPTLVAFWLPSVLLVFPVLMRNRWMTPCKRLQNFVE